MYQRSIVMNLADLCHKTQPRGWAIFADFHSERLGVELADEMAQ